MEATAVSKKQLGVVKAQLTKAVKIANEIVITSPEDYEKAATKLIEVKKLEKDFNKEKKSWLDPINELRNKVFSVSRPIEAKFKEVKDQIDRSMTKWEQKVEEERRKEADRLEAEAEKKRIEAEKKAAKGEITKEEAQQETADSLAKATDEAGKLPSTKQVVTPKGTAGTRQVHELVVVDFEALPNEFKLPNMPKIKEYWRTNGQYPAGCEIQTKIVRTTRAI